MITGSIDNGDHTFADRNQRPLTFPINCSVFYDAPYSCADFESAASAGDLICKTNALSCYTMEGLWHSILGDVWGKGHMVYTDANGGYMDWNAGT